MAVQLITYDLRQPGRNYNDLFEGIRNIGDWWHCLESVWLVNCTLSSQQIRDRLLQYIDTNDKLVVLGLNGNWGSYGLSDECNNWLRNNVGA